MSTLLTALALVAATPGLLVSPAELAAALKDPATIVIAVGNSEDDFIAGHIPGARFVRDDDIAIDAGGLSSELPPVDRQAMYRDTALLGLNGNRPLRRRR